MSEIWGLPNVMIGPRAEYGPLVPLTKDENNDGVVLYGRWTAYRPRAERTIPTPPMKPQTQLQIRAGTASTTDSCTIRTETSILTSSMDKAPYSVIPALNVILL